MVSIYYRGNHCESKNYYKMKTLWFIDLFPFPLIYNCCTCMLIVLIIYCPPPLFLRATMSSPQNVVQLSVHLATMLLDVTMGFLERILGEELSPPTLGLLGGSFLFSTLLPTTLAQLGPVACRQPKVSLCPSFSELLWSVLFTQQEFISLNLRSRGGKKSSSPAWV